MGKATGNITKIAALMRYSISKILLKKQIYIAFLILITVIAVMGYAGTQQTDRLSTGSNLMGTLIVWFFMPAICMIYGCSLIRDEIEDKSITHVFTSPFDRTVAYIGYYLSLILCLCLIIAVITTAGFLSFFALQGLDGDAFTIYNTFIILVFLGVIVYSALFLFSSVLFKRPIYFGLFFVFIWEGFIGNIPGKIQKISINHYLRSIGADQLQFLSVADAADVTTAFIVLLGALILFIILGIVLFKTREFT